MSSQFFKDHDHSLQLFTAWQPEKLGIVPHVSTQAQRKDRNRIFMGPRWLLRVSQWSWLLLVYEDTGHRSCPPCTPSCCTHTKDELSWPLLLLGAWKPQSLGQRALAVGSCLLPDSLTALFPRMMISSNSRPGSVGKDRQAYPGPEMDVLWPCSEV